MVQYTYKQKLGLQDQRGKGILVGKLFSGCVNVGKSLNLSGLGFLICKMKMLNYMILKTQLISKILQNNLGLWGYLDDSHVTYTFSCSIHWTLTLVQKEMTKLYETDTNQWA